MYRPPNAAGAFDEEDGDFQSGTGNTGGYYGGGGGGYGGYMNNRVGADRDFLRRNFTTFNSIHVGLQEKFAVRSHRDRKVTQPHFASLMNITTAHANILSPANGICSHYLRRGFTKPKHQLTSAVWSADARWLVIGTEIGDFYLWEGESLKVLKPISQTSHRISETERIPITCLAWNNHGNSIVSGDNNGLIQFGDESYRYSFAIRDAHSAAVRGLSFSPFDSRLASGSDDGTVKIWVVGRDQPELVLAEHQSDVKCIDYHPYRSLIASGSRDGAIKLWDPKQGSCVSNISSHKKSVQCCEWNLNGNWLATGSKDANVKIFDIRTMKEIESLRGHNSDVCSLGWHPQHESLLLSGGYNGSLIYWIVGHNQTAHTAIADAHRQSVDVIAWHPAGHLVATASHDCMLKFWCREAPGSTLDAAPTNEFSDNQPPVYGYGPLPQGIPSVIQQTSSSLLHQAGEANTSGTGETGGFTPAAGGPPTTGSSGSYGNQSYSRGGGRGFSGRTYFGRGGDTNNNNGGGYSGRGSAGFFSGRGRGGRYFGAGGGRGGGGDESTSGGYGRGSKRPRDF